MVAVQEAATHAKEVFTKVGRPVPKMVLRLPDLDQAKSAVLNSLTSKDAQRGYRHAIDEFIEWYCSEPRLSFSKAVVLRYRMHWESRHLAPGTINLPLGAVRRLSYEAADCELLSSDLAAGIRRIKGVKRFEVRLGNWLTSEQSQRPWRCASVDNLKVRRDRALLALLLASGLRGHEAIDLEFGHLQQREEHWAIVHLRGKPGHTRTVPVPGWVKGVLDDWTQAAWLTSGKLPRRVNRNGKAWGTELIEKAVWQVVNEYARKADMERLTPHDLRRTCARLRYAAGGALEQIQFLLGHVSIQMTERNLGGKQRIRWAVNDRIGIEPGL
ncbi:tyrosine-type recombinase/integrase [Paludibaculum fermentans]|uniref:tyrosine-type recombinase/integrase n=1 Tax=Paludibaculum fermentans TaxID=1473598 RepID=UPI003EC10A12